MRNMKSIKKVGSFALKDMKRNYCFLETRKKDNEKDKLHCQLFQAIFYST